MISLIETTLVQYDLLFQYNFPIRQILEPLYLNIILLEKIDAIFFCRNDQVPFKRCANVRLCNCATMQLCNRSILQLCDCATPRLFNCAIVQGPFLAGAKIGACLAARPSFAYNPYKSRNLQAGTALLTHFWWNPKIPGDFLTLPILGMVGYEVLQSGENLFRPFKRKTCSWWTWKCGL